MNIVSTRLLVGFIVIASAGASVAQTAPDGLAGLSKSDISAGAIGARAQSSLRLNAPSQNLLAGALAAKPSTGAVLRGSDGAASADTASVKLGDAVGTPSPGDDALLFSKPVSPARMANALSAGTPSAGEIADGKAQLMLGIPTTNAGNPSGGERINASQRLGR